jgi:thiol-disulfide isomerase/thioredoxin
MNSTSIIRIILLLQFAGMMVLRATASQWGEITLTIRNQPETIIVLGSVRGDKFTPVDSINTRNLTKKDNAVTVTFSLKDPAVPGMYRLVLGQTTYARMMNEPPRQLDFIYNQENVAFVTDFRAPSDSLTILESEENRIWSAFQKREQKFRQEIRETEMELDHFRPAGPGSANQRTEYEKRVVQYNRLHRERDLLISDLTARYPALFSAKLIALHREPRPDGNLPADERLKVFHNEYFSLISFTDESVMNSSVYTERIFRYFMSYARRGLTREQQEAEFLKAVDSIIAAVRENEKVYEFILDYLVRGFERLGLTNLIRYIAENYAGSTCQTDEKTTLERRLGEQLMLPGTKVPDFTMDDINSDPVTLSKISKKRNLLIFWASWCPHCVEMIPQVRAAVKNTHNSEMAIIAISLDTSHADWTKAVSAMGTESWVNLSDLKGWDGALAAEYNIYATPTFLLIGDDLSIAGKPMTLQEILTLIKE